jgi:hypothetical protein
MIGVRLQGGPFDGDRARIERLDRELRQQPPAVIFVRRCPHCSDTDWLLEPVGYAEVYRRDEESAGWLIYVYTDQDLDRHITLTRSVLALDGAGA